jgi:hypothetical protein
LNQILRESGLSRSAAAGKLGDHMRTQYAIEAVGAGAVGARRMSMGLGILVLLTALSPILVVSGYMLAQILGYAPN